MRFGEHLRELWRLRLGLTLCVLAAALAALSTAYEVNIAPPGLSPRSLELASASTEVLVDTPRSALLDPPQSTADVEAMTNRAILLGNVMASPPVQTLIALRAGVPPARIRTVAPITPDFPRPVANEANRKRTSDLFGSLEEYRLSVESPPNVPILQINAQAPTVATSQRLANAAVDGLRDYIARLAAVQGIEADQQVRLEQLGRAQGRVVNDGVGVQAALLAFVIVFAATAAAGIFVSRVRRGWSAARERETVVAAS